MDTINDLFEEVDSVIKFKDGLIHEIMKLISTDTKTRFSNESVTVVNDILLIFLKEAIWRTANQARNEGMTIVTIDHLEKILPQLLLDFS